MNGDTAFLHTLTGLGPSIKYVTRKGEEGGGLSQRDDAYIKYTISMG